MNILSKKMYWIGIGINLAYLALVWSKISDQVCIRWSASDLSQCVAHSPKIGLLLTLVTLFLLTFIDFGKSLKGALSLWSPYILPFFVYWFVQVIQITVYQRNGIEYYPLLSIIALAAFALVWLYQIGTIKKD